MSKFKLSIKSKTDGVEFDLLHPETGEPIVSDGKKATFVVYGSASDKNKEFEKQMADKYIAQQKFGKKVELKQEDIEKQAIARRVALCGGIKNIPTAEGLIDVVASEDLIELFKDPEAEWIVKQVAAKQDDDSNFIVG